MMLAAAAGGPGIGAPPTLTYVTNLVARWRAYDLALSDGASVGTWADTSGNSNDLTQATAGFKPLFRLTGGPNTRPAVQFDGTDDTLSSVALVMGDPHTTFIVFKASESGVILKHDPTGSVNGSPYFSSSTTFTLFHQDTGAPGGENEKDHPTGVGWAADSVWRYVSWRYTSTGPSHLLWVNGSSVSLTNIANNAPTANGSKAVAMATDGGSAFQACYIAEVLIYGEAMSAGNRGTVETYLAATYNL